MSIEEREEAVIGSQTCIPDLYFDPIYMIAGFASLFHCSTKDILTARGLENKMHGQGNTESNGPWHRAYRDTTIEMDTFLGISHGGNFAFF